MLYTKAIKRIDISINELNRRKLTEIDGSCKWVTADKKEALNENFNLDDVSFMCLIYLLTSSSSDFL